MPCDILEKTSPNEATKQYISQYYWMKRVKSLMSNLRMRQERGHRLWWSTIFSMVKEKMTICCGEVHLVFVSPHSNCKYDWQGKCTPECTHFFSYLKCESWKTVSSLWDFCICYATFSSEVNQKYWQMESFMYVYEWSNLFSCEKFGVLFIKMACVNSTQKIENYF